MIELNSYPTLLNDANLLAYYRFENNLIDSKSGLNGTNSGVTYSTGQFGNAGIFNGASYFTLPESTSFDATSMTINFVIKLNSATAGYTVIYDHWDETTSSGYYAGLSIKHYTDGVNKFRTEVEISNRTLGNSTVNTVDYGTSDTNYHLLTITLSGTTTEIYFDNVLRSTKTNHSSIDYSTNPVIYVGCNHREYGGSNIYFLNGAIDDMSIFTRKLSYTELNNYWNGIEIPIQTYNAKTLVVGGGGGGGYGRAGGGGGGQVLYSTSVDLCVGDNSVTIGSGGNGGNGSSISGGNGGASSIGNRHAIGGGGGASEISGSGLNGASGGGGVGKYSTYSNLGGTGTAGFNGGNGVIQENANYLAGGGGGAGGVGGNGTTTNGGNGGAGITNSISGTSLYYAGGGGGGGNGGTPGTGTNGGGNGQVTAGTAGGAGAVNTGSGGGGGAGTVTRGVGGVGGSGIVIISYATDGSDGISNTSTGGTITTSGTQTIHTFTSSGTFTLVESGISTNNSGFFQFF